MQTTSENIEQVDEGLVKQLRQSIQLKTSELEETKSQHRSSWSEIRGKCKEIELKLLESNAKCIEFEQQAENDKQRMMSLSSQHEQVS